METRIFLDRYRLSLGRDDLPVELHRTPAIVTYRGQDVETGREVALDLVTVDTSEPDVRERLIAEAKRAQEVNNIHLLSLYDFGFDRGQMVYITEYFEGYTAAAWVAARGPLPTAIVIRIALQIASAIGATAFYRIYHHALNPDNLLFGSGPAAHVGFPEVKVPHWFGISSPRERSMAGAPSDAMRYASPEQLSSGLVDVRSEIYSLGGMMWFLLTGVPPVGAQSAAPEGRSLLPAEELRGVPKILSQLISLMLDPDPEKRPHDPIALADALQTCLNQVERRRRGEIAAVSPTAAVPRKASGASSVRVWGVVAATVAAIALAAAFVLSPRYLAGLAAPFRQSVKTHAATAPGSGDESGDEGSDPVVEVPHSKSERQPPSALAAHLPPPAEGPSAVAATASSPLVETTEPLDTPKVATPAKIAVEDGNPPSLPPVHPISGSDSEWPVQTDTSSPAANSAGKAAGGQEAPDQVVAVASTAAAIEKPAVLEEQIAATHPIVVKAGEPTAAAEASAAPLAVATPPPALVSASVAPPAAESSGELPAGSGQHLAMAAPPRPVSEEPTPEPSVAEPVVKPEVQAKSEENTPPPRRMERLDRRKTAAAAKETPAHKTENEPEAKVARASKAESQPHEKQPTVKRAKLIPQLHFGAEPAELVGTTRDGRWILSVGTSGKRVVVQPPPDFSGR